MTYFKGLKLLLNNIDTEDNQTKISKLIYQAKLERNEELNKLKQKQVIEKVISSENNDEKNGNQIYSKVF